MSAFFASEDGYMLMTFTRKPAKMVVDVKKLDGMALDRQEYGPKEKTDK